MFRKNRFQICCHVPSDKIPRRGGPLCPPAGSDADSLTIDVGAALARWMSRTRAEVAGCFEKNRFQICCHVPSDKIPRRGGPLCPPAGSDVDRLPIGVVAALAR